MTEIHSEKIFHLWFPPFAVLSPFCVCQTEDISDMTRGGFSTVVHCALMERERRTGPLHHWEHIFNSVWMAFDLAHINHYLLIHRPLGFLPLHPFKSILQNSVVSVGRGFLQSGNSSNHLRLFLSLFLSLAVSLSARSKPALSNKPRSTNLCRDSAKPCLPTGKEHHQNYSVLPWK